MRALETEVSRLREAYTTEIAEANAAVQQHKEMMHATREENEILKEILAANGIQYEADLERRRAERPPMVFQSPVTVAGSSTASQTAPLTNSASNHNTTPPTTISSGMSPHGMDQAVSPPIGYAPQVYQAGMGEHSMSMDHSSCAPVDTMQPMPAPAGGVFETDPQLQVDFILT